MLKSVLKTKLDWIGHQLSVSSEINPTGRRAEDKTLNPTDPDEPGSPAKGQTMQTDEWDKQDETRQEEWAWFFQKGRRSRFKHVGSGGNPEGIWAPGRPASEFCSFSEHQKVYFKLKAFLGKGGLRDWTSEQRCWPSGWFPLQLLGKIPQLVVPLLSGSCHTVSKVFTWTLLTPAAGKLNSSFPVLILSQNQKKL